MNLAPGMCGICPKPAMKTDFTPFCPLHWDEWQASPELGRSLVVVDGPRKLAAMVDFAIHPSAVDRRA